MEKHLDYLTIVKNFFVWGWCTGIWGILGFLILLTLSR